MNSLRKFAAIAVFTLSSLGLVSVTASAQTANGSFTLPHEVNWQSAVVPAGDYKFSFEPKGPSFVLTLRSVSGDHAAFIILPNNIASSEFSESNRLVMVSRAGKSFVSALDLPEFETTLHFAVPAEGAEKELALASDTPVPTHLR